MMFRAAETEHGTTALLVAGTLILLMGMAAIAIDVGAGFNERRQNQTAADVGVLAGALDYLDLGRCGAPTNDPADGGCNRLLELVRANLSTTYADADWIAAWRTCADQLQGFTALPVHSAWGTGFPVNSAGHAVVPCISQSAQELRVRVPDQFLDTTFGAVLGVDELITLATAHAALEVSPLGGLLPFGILSGSGAHTCLLTAPSGNAEPPCDGPASGNFYTLESQTWGPPSSQLTLTDCNNPGSPELAINTALGIDHFIDTADDFSPPDPAIYSFDNSPTGTADDLTTREDRCTLSSSGVAMAVDQLPDAGPRDTLLAGTGADDSSPVLRGLVTGKPADFAANAPNGGNNVVPRLLNNGNCLLPQGATTKSCETYELKEKIGSQTFSYHANNEPLWNYLIDFDLGSTGAIPCPAAGASVQTDEDVDSTETMQCLLDGVPPNTVLFSDLIETNPRFARVPEFHFSVWGPGTHWQPVKKYRMIYLHSLWFSSGNTNHEFEADGASNGSLCIGNNQNNCANLNLLQLEAFLLPHDTVPDVVADSFPGGSADDSQPFLTR